MTENCAKLEYAAAVARIAADTYATIGEYIKADRFATELHLREIGACYLEHGGKCLRPALMNFCCQAAGGASSSALRAGAAAEMFHTWTLVHDDVIDHDDLRRGRPTAHVRGARLGAAELNLPELAAWEYGRDLAILGGDLLQGQAVDMLLAAPISAELRLTLAHRMSAKLTAEVLSGEQMDVRLSQTPWEAITEDAIMEMMRLKTGALLAFCAETGTAIGENSNPETSPAASSMAEFAHWCGLAFQMQDDILGVFGDESKFGKPIGSDIREGKRTVLMLDTLKNASVPDMHKLTSILGRQDASDFEINDARNIILSTGAADSVTKLADGFVKKALNILQKTFKPSAARDNLEQWALAMVARSI